MKLSLQSLWLAVVVASPGLAGCDAPPSPAKDVAALRPSEPALAERYERACRPCHATPGSGAPLVGDRSAWAARSAAGADALLAAVRNGKGTMPPMGWCPDCSDAELRALIDFLRRGGRP